MVLAVLFEAGQTVVRRGIHRNNRISGVESARVISDDDRGLLLWVGEGSTVMRRTTLDGQPVRKMPLSEKFAIPTMLRPTGWRDGGVLILTPPGAYHSIWWFFNGRGGFHGWYVNLEAPVGRWASGYDMRDQALDVRIWPDYRWEWKDEDEFTDRIGHPVYWEEEEVPAIRAEGERMIALAKERRYPFDGTHVDFKPDPTWAPTTLPADWDVPHLRGFSGPN
jgi:hypothetical protein